MKFMREWHKIIPGDVGEVKNIPYDGTGIRKCMELTNGINRYQISIICLCDRNGCEYRSACFTGISISGKREPATRLQINGAGRGHTNKFLGIDEAADDDGNLSGKCVKCAQNDIRLWHRANWRLNKSVEAR